MRSVGKNEIDGALPFLHRLDALPPFHRYAYRRDLGVGE